MPSAQPLPTIADLVTAAGNALVGQRDRYGDDRSGGIYNHATGPTAILFARQADRDQDVFRAIYFDDADGDDLTQLIQDRFQTPMGAPLVPRILDTRGQGTATFARSAATAGAGTFWTGTRLQVQAATPAVYEFAQDTPIASTATSITVPIQAFATGTGSALNVSGGITLKDAVYDPLWLPTSLTCADGTDFEEANAYRARTRAFLLANRNGYIPRLVQVCQDAGATYVIAFSSDYGLKTNQYEYDFHLGVGDMGLNAIYVADGGFSSTSTLLNACAIALEGARVLGADLWVGGIAQNPLSIAATVTLVDDPGVCPLVVIRNAITQALLAYFAPTQAAYLYKLSALESAMRRASPYVQTVTFTSPTSEPTISPTNWPATLIRYVLSPQNIAITFAPPI